MEICVLLVHGFALCGWMVDAKIVANDGFVTMISVG